MNSFSSTTIIAIMTHTKEDFLTRETLHGCILNCHFSNDRYVVLPGWAGGGIPALAAAAACLQQKKIDLFNTFKTKNIQENLNCLLSNIL